MDVIQKFAIAVNERSTRQGDQHKEKNIKSWSMSHPFSLDVVATSLYDTYMSDRPLHLLSTPSLLAATKRTGDPKGLMMLGNDLNAALTARIFKSKNLPGKEEFDKTALDAVDLLTGLGLRVIKDEVAIRHQSHEDPATKTYQWLTGSIDYIALDKDDQVHVIELKFRTERGIFTGSVKQTVMYAEATRRILNLPELPPAWILVVCPKEPGVLIHRIKYPETKSYLKQILPKDELRFFPHLFRELFHSGSKEKGEDTLFILEVDFLDGSRDRFVLDNDHVRVTILPTIKQDNEVEIKDRTAFVQLFKNMVAPQNRVADKSLHKFESQVAFTIVVRDTMNVSSVFPYIVKCVRSLAWWSTTEPVPDVIAGESPHFHSKDIEGGAFLITFSEEGISIQQPQIQRIFSATFHAHSPHSTSKKVHKRCYLVHFTCHSIKPELNYTLELTILNVVYRTGEDDRASCFACHSNKSALGCHLPERRVGLSRVP